MTKFKVIALAVNGINGCVLRADDIVDADYFPAGHADELVKQGFLEVVDDTAAKAAEAAAAQAAEEAAAAAQAAEEAAAAAQAAEEAAAAKAAEEAAAAAQAAEEAGTDTQASGKKPKAK